MAEPNWSVQQSITDNVVLELYGTRFVVKLPPGMSVDDLEHKLFTLMKKLINEERQAAKLPEHYETPVSNKQLLKRGQQRRETAVKMLESILMQSGPVDVHTAARLAVTATDAMDNYLSEL